MRFLLLIAIIFSCASNLSAESFSVGSKTFTESYILGELFAQKLETDLEGVSVDRELGMGGTGVLFNALQSKDIDFYPEYTGTISEAILKKPQLKTVAEINAALKDLGLVISKPIGINNTYAIAMRKDDAQRLGIEKISDLKDHLDLNAAFTYEFMKRSDGFDALMSHYGFRLRNAKGIEHSLAYQAIAAGEVDVIDVFATDAKIETLDLFVLEDDKSFFPRYDAVILARQDFVQKHPQAWKSLRELEGKFTEEAMIEMNAMVDEGGATFFAAAQSFFGGKESGALISSLRWKELWQKTKEHLFLVFFSLTASILFGVPLGILATRSKLLAQIVLAFSGLIQTIPSLALLCFFIPFLGIGTIPALAALFLYGLLPIVRNTYLGLTSIDSHYKESTLVMGLSPFQRLMWTDIPMAMDSILTGIKTSAIIGVGTATLAAFIGAGGYGAFIVTGLALNSIPIILQGAIPAAILALVLQGMFEIVDRFMVPRGIRFSQA